MSKINGQIGLEGVDRIRLPLFESVPEVKNLDDFWACIALRGMTAALQPEEHKALEAVYADFSSAPNPTVFADQHFRHGVDEAGGYVDVLVSRGLDD